MLLLTVGALYVHGLHLLLALHDDPAALLPLLFERLATKTVQLIILRYLLLLLELLFRFTTAAARFRSVIGFAIFEQ